MLLWRVRTRRLAILACAVAGVAFLDLLEPGRGKFINPINKARSAIEAHQVARWIEANRVDPNDQRLLNCEVIAPDPVAIDATAANIRRALVGESEVLTLTALGAPACDLGNGVYRWVLSNGLALDVTVNEGEITHSELNR
ncbi:hypothetical protein [Phormidium sp. FACHB-1136]|jgi:hypothetical protein|uniref:hypothetical protein n=1 Tax=Phormidium sp. FACHB-1136 TaxID=2692848 RepID=UPI001689FA1D|nr:hypothetical protein [Phormidium sp. FACHB-1136]MBD2427957.1 hypothetical protein [Phormidium sp. FACHB-1136]